jgi:hypothetical protein
MKTPQDKVVLYMIVSVVALIVLWMIIGALLASVLMGVFGLSVLSGTRMMGM